MLVISYGSRELAHRCTKLELAQEWLGPADAQALIDLIADLEASENAAELIAFRDGRLCDIDFLSFAFSPRYRAILRPAGSEVPRNSDGQPSWERVRRLLLVDIKEL